MSEVPLYHTNLSGAHVAGKKGQRIKVFLGRWAFLFASVPCRIFEWGICWIRWRVKVHDKRFGGEYFTIHSSRGRE